MKINSVTHKVAVVAGAALTMSVLAALPAQATTVYSGFNSATSTGTLGPGTFGASVTPSQVLARAQDWVNDAVAYSQTDGWVDGTVGGPWRADCSGFVSMVWGLQTSYTTYTLPEVSHELTSGGAADYSQLQPGDALLWVGDQSAQTGHVELFAGWADSAHTTAFIYEEPHSGKDAEYGTDTLSDFESGGFLPYRYNKITPPTNTLSAVVPTGSATDQLHTMTIESGILHQVIQSDSGAWANNSTGIAVSGPVSAVVPTGSSTDQSHVMAVENGTLYQIVQSNSGAWANNSTGIAVSGPISAVVPTGSSTDQLHVMAVENGTLYQIVQSKSGAWADNSTGIAVNGPISAVVPTGSSTDQLHVMAVENGTLFQVVQSDSGAWANNSTGIAVSGPISAVVPTGSSTDQLHVMAVENGTLFQVVQSNAGAWANNSTGIAVNGSISAVVPTGSPTDQLHVMAVESGTLFQVVQSNAGAWANNSSGLSVS